MLRFYLEAGEVRYSSHRSCLSCAYLVSEFTNVELNCSTCPLQHGLYAVVLALWTLSSLHTSLVSLEILLVSSRVESVSGDSKLSVDGIAGVAEEFLSDDAIGEVTVDI